MTQEEWIKLGRCRGRNGTFNGVKATVYVPTPGTKLVEDEPVLELQVWSKKPGPRPPIIISGRMEAMALLARLILDTIDERRNL